MPNLREHFDNFDVINSEAYRRYQEALNTIARQKKEILDHMTRDNMNDSLARLNELDTEEKNAFAIFVRDLIAEVMGASPEAILAALPFPERINIKHDRRGDFFNGDDLKRNVGGG